MAKATSLTEFAQRKRTEGTYKHCAVCQQVPLALRQEIRAVNKKLCPGSVIVAWLKSERGIDVTLDALQAHLRHHQSADAKVTD
jgi:hypothetical protein